MKNNLAQVKKDGLPIVSEERKVQQNSMRLYLYLVSISKFCGRDKPREFMQNNFSINKIHELLGMHSETIKKYWKLLEDNKLIQYQGPQDFEDKFLSQQEWNKKFMARKKYSSGFYKIPKGELYRIIPRETVDKLQNVFLVDEIELKLYLLLANMQEHFCYMKSPERLFTLQDLRELLKMSKKVDNNKKIILSLCWLEKLNLIEYSLFEDVTNLGTKKYVFNLISVNYYTDGGQIENMLSSAEDSKLTSEMKERILTEQVVYFEE